MSDVPPRSRRPEGNKIPRIEAMEAARIYEQCDRLDDDASAPLACLRTAAFGTFIGELEERILQLAVQPDSWGERTRARLIAEIIHRLTGIPVSSRSLDHITRISNVLIPFFFILELGRRRQHIQIEFPRNPCEPDAQLALKTGISPLSHSISADQLISLVTEAGEELVGLCYFGDDPSRAAIEALLATFTTG